MKCKECGGEISIYCTIPIGKNGERNPSDPKHIVRHLKCLKCKRKPPKEVETDPQKPIFPEYV